MTGDHHDRTARRATLLVTVTDEILGRCGLRVSTRKPREHAGHGEVYEAEEHERRG
jgi:hypothetical protein